jgi:hypothetical protein
MPCDELDYVAGSLTATESDRGTLMHHPLDLLARDDDDVYLSEDDEASANLSLEDDSDDILGNVDLPDFANMDRQGILNLLERILQATDLTGSPLAGNLSRLRNPSGALSSWAIDDLPRGVLSSDSESEIVLHLVNEFKLAQVP